MCQLPVPPHSSREVEKEGLPWSLNREFPSPHGNHFGAGSMTGELSEEVTKDNHRLSGWTDILEADPLRSRGHLESSRSRSHGCHVPAQQISKCHVYEAHAGTSEMRLVGRERVYGTVRHTSWLRHTEASDPGQLAGQEFPGCQTFVCLGKTDQFVITGNPFSLGKYFTQKNNSNSAERCGLQPSVRMQAGSASAGTYSFFQCRAFTRKHSGSVALSPTPLSSLCPHTGHHLCPPFPSCFCLFFRASGASPTL